MRYDSVCQHIFPSWPSAHFCDHNSSKNVYLSLEHLSIIARKKTYSFMMTDNMKIFKEADLSCNVEIIKHILQCRCFAWVKSQTEMSPLVCADGCHSTG